MAGVGRWAYSRCVRLCTLKHGQNRSLSENSVSRYRHRPCSVCIQACSDLFCRGIPLELRASSCRVLPLGSDPGVNSRRRNLCVYDPSRCGIAAGTVTGKKSLRRGAMRWRLATFMNTAPCAAALTWNAPPWATSQERSPP